MSAGDYYAGAFFLVATWGAVFAATEILVRRRLGRLCGATRATAWGIVATAGILITTLLPAALTILSRETALVTAVLLLVAALMTPRRQAQGSPRTPAGEAEDVARVIPAFAAIGALGAALWLVAVFVEHAAEAPLGYDAVSAYLPTAARWLQEGSIWQIADWVPGSFYGSGPGNGSALVLAAMLPFDSDFLARLAIYPYVVLMVIALYALARECGAPTPLATLIALVTTAAPVIVQPALVNSLLDPVMYAALAAGLLFLVRHHKHGDRADLALAGLALGICFGTKFYGYTTVAAIALVWIAARLIAGVPRVRVARQAGFLGAIVLAAGGIWMLRNWVVTGNPLMPLKVDPLGITIFDAPPDQQRPFFGQTLWSYLDQPAVWVDTLAHQFRIAVGLPLLAVAAGLVAAAVALWRRGRRAWGSAEGIAAASIAAALLLVLVYAITPYTAPGLDGPDAAAINVRYGIPAMIAAVPALAWLTGTLGPRARVAVAALALVALVDALRVGTTTAPRVVYASFAAAALIVVAVALARRADRVPGRPRAGVVLGAAGAALVLAVIAGDRLQDSYNDSRYLGKDPVIDRIVESGGASSEIGLAGAWTFDGVIPTYPAFGTRLQNRVTYLGPVEDAALLRTYNDPGEFTAAVADAEPDLLVLGRNDDLPFPQTPPPATGAELEDWALAAGYRRIAQSDRFLLLERLPSQR